MRKIFLIVLMLYILLFTLTGCQSAEEYYENKSIRIEVCHTSCFDTYAEYDVYFENLKKGESFALPNGEANPYKVSVTITDINKDFITLAFSQPMDRIISGENSKWELGIDSFSLKYGSAERFVTPTDGGGDSFSFSIVDKG